MSDFKWKEVSVGVTIPVPQKGSPMWREVKTFVRDLDRQIRECKERTAKEMAQIVTGVTQYHHGDKI